MGDARVHVARAGQVGDLDARRTSTPSACCSTSSSRGSSPFEGGDRRQGADRAHHPEAGPRGPRRTPRWTSASTPFCLKALAKDPRDRYASAREMRRAIRLAFAPPDSMVGTGSYGEAAGAEVQDGAAGGARGGEGAGGAMARERLAPIARANGGAGAKGRAGGDAGGAARRGGRVGVGDRGARGGRGGGVGDGDAVRAGEGGRT